ncbi:LysR family transcriptional regulator [Streptomyces sp. NPDC053048]|uniref:LysR family transcriptional regulator n=1 Tax=Streptomyces sp. NPDC053048 TaxID=3365694 RepID=UPI0037D19855
MFDLHKLRLLRELKHRGTLAAVAAALSYSPSSVSQQLSQLEAQAGVPLLEPVGRRVRLTPQAEILVGHTEAVLERLERAEADIAASLTGLTGILRIACYQSAAFALAPHLLTLLREAHPGLRVHLVQAEPEQALPALLAHDFDLVVTEEYPGNPDPRPPGLELEELHQDPLRLATPPGEGGEVRLADLRDRPWVMEPEGSASRRWALTLCRTAGFEPDIRFESADLLFHARLVEHGHAMAFLPDLVRSGRTPAVVLHPLPQGLDARKIITAVRVGSSRHPAIEACRKALRRAVADLEAPSLTGGL